MLYSNMYLSFYLAAIGNLVYAILVIARISDKQYEALFTIFIEFATFGTANWRTTFLTIVIERTIATVYYKTYDKHGSLVIAIMLFIVGNLGMAVPILYYNCKF